MKMWLYVNKLSLNIDKTNFIIFKSPQHFFSGTVNIKIVNLAIKQTFYVKFLGVLLDENLSYGSITHQNCLSNWLENLWSVF